MPTPLRIAQVAPPIERVPPDGYGGTERVIYELVRELAARGHEVTTFASGDSDVPGEHVETVPRALRNEGFGGAPTGFVIGTMLQVLDHATEFDVIHSHLEWMSIPLSRATTVPVAATFHGRLDLPWARSVLEPSSPVHLVAISESQAADHPSLDWTIVHNGLTLKDAPFERRRSDDLVFVGRVTPEKGIIEAIQIAELSGRHLKIAAKVGTTPEEQAYNDDVFQPALKKAGSAVEFVGELSGDDRDELISTAYAVLMPGSWPEPFGLVAIESLACGTPVLARRVGGLSEIIRDGVDGFFGDDVTQLAFSVPRVAELDRDEIRASVIERFSAERMADGYEALYRRMLGEAESPAAEAEPEPDPERVVEMAARR
ncbi:MAG TPA: glycosyltransferase family 4 protein [Candidatus Limnocylindrales bacterium]|nr:glycosyltransferase family 4 protein [Candidatus Limnocylindrales bacterium]